jgi:hypothetical protein
MAKQALSFSRYTLTLDKNETVYSVMRSRVVGNSQANANMAVYHGLIVVAIVRY